MKRSGSYISSLCLTAMLLLLTTGRGVADELQVEQISPDREARDCFGENCSLDVDIPCVPGIEGEGDLPGNCAEADEGTTDRAVGDTLIPRVEDPQDSSGIPLIPGVTINQ